MAQKGKKSAVLAGGVACYNAFLKSGLVNEMYLGIMPVMLQGERLEIASVAHRLSLKGTAQLDDQTIQLHYTFL